MHPRLLQTLAVCVCARVCWRRSKSFCRRSLESQRGRTQRASACACPTFQRLLPRSLATTASESSPRTFTRALSRCSHAVARMGNASAPGLARERTLRGTSIGTSALAHTRTCANSAYMRPRGHSSDSSSSTVDGSSLMCTGSSCYTSTTCSALSKANMCLRLHGQGVQRDVLFYLYESKGMVRGARDPRSCRW